MKVHADYSDDDDFTRILFDRNIIVKDKPPTRRGLLFRRSGLGLSQQMQTIQTQTAALVHSRQPVISKVFALVNACSLYIKIIRII